MEPILLIICITVTTLIGWAILNIIFYKLMPFSLFERAALSYGLGIGVVTLEIFLFHFLKAPLNILNLLIPWIPIIIFGLFVIRTDSSPISRDKNKFSLFEKFLLAGISFEVIYAFFRTFLKPVDSFDSIAMYAIRSKIIYLSRGIPADFFKNITVNFPNPDYPLLVPLAEVWVYTFLGNLNDLLVKAIFPIYLLSFLIIFFFLLKRFMGRSQALLFTFLLATIPQFNHFATVGYTDFILAYYYSIALILILLWIKEKSFNLLALSAVFTGFAMWTKNEGIALCIINLILLALFLIGSFNKRFLGQIIIFILIAILISGPWLVLRTSMRLDNEVLQLTTFNLKRFTDISKRLDRIPTILYEFQKQFVGPKKWNIIWILFFVVFFTNFRRAFSDDLKYVTLPIILILFSYGAVYLLLPVRGPIGWYVARGISRLFIHFVPITVLWLALICRRSHLV